MLQLITRTGTGAIVFCLFVFRFYGPVNPMGGNNVLCHMIRTITGSVVDCRVSEGLVPGH